MLRAVSRLRSLPCSRIHLLSPTWCANIEEFSSKRRGKNEIADEDNEEKNRAAVSLFGRDPSRPPRLLVVQPRLRPDKLLESKLAEALNLANSLEEPRDGDYADDFATKGPPPHLVVQNPAARSRPHADTFFGPGTVDNVKVHIRTLESKDDLDAIFVNTILSGIQQRNLEVAWAKPVLDRVGLIIEIFNAHAETKEAKLQAELAALMYKRSRLVRVRGPGGRLAFGTSGEAEVVSARGRGSGGRGFISGAGETELQLQRRRIQERRNHLLAQIEEVRRTRALQRASRRRRGDSEGHGLATVAVVGYTNAGKSTLVSALSETDLYSDDRLFATVDPRLRSVILPSGRKALLSDTVGFISELPVQLVEAFHATLEEVVEADLLVHVLDSSAPNIDEHRETVLQVLEQIGVSEDKLKNMIEVWNKIDLLQKDHGVDAVDEDEDLDEYEGDKLSEHDRMAFEYSCSEGLDGDDEVLELSSAETMEGDNAESMEGDGVASELSSSETMDENSTDLEVSEDACSRVSEEARKDAVHCEPNYDNHVKTSAVTGVGLQELLSLIDEELNKQNVVQRKHFEAFDRKWRPSNTTESEKVAQQ